MKFIPIRHILSEFQINVDRINLAVLPEIIAQLKTLDSNKVVSIAGNDFTINEIIAQISQINNENEFVFQDWVLQQKELFNLISLGNFNDQIKANIYKGHVLESDFKTYLTGFLFPILSNKIASDRISTNIIAQVLAFTDFLSTNQKGIIQNKCSVILKNSFKKFKTNLHSIHSKGELVKLINFFITTELIDCLNLLDKIYYSTRIDFIQIIKDIVCHKDCDVFVISTFKSKLAQLKLNPEHMNEMNGFMEITYQNKKKILVSSGRSRSILKYMWVLIVVILLGLSLFMINNNQYKDDKNNIIVHNGLDSLKTDEIANLDTLLGLNTTQNDILIEPPINDNPDLVFSTNSQNIINELIVQLRNDMRTDYNIQNNLLINDSCASLHLTDCKNFIYPGITLMDEVTNRVHQVKNESAYDCYLIVFDNQLNGKVYGKFIPNGGKIDIAVKPNYYAFFYLGKELTTFNPALNGNNGYGNLAEAQKISRDFSTHYCELDYNTLLLLNRNYKLKNESGQTIIKGDFDAGIHIDSKVFELQ